MESFRRGAGELESDLTAQLELLGERAPSCRRVLLGLIELLGQPGSGTATAFERAWKHRRFDAYYERPLLLLASLRHDALVEGETHPLWAALGAAKPDPDAASLEALATAIGPDRLGFWMTLRTRRVQTNDVSRAVTWLWPATLVGALEGREIALADVGASAGLNLVADALDLGWTDASGKALPTARGVAPIERLGFDSRPLDALREDDVRWLRACIWPGEAERLERLDRAIEAFRRVAPQPYVALFTASSVPARLQHLEPTFPPRAVLMVYQTLVSGYLQAEERAAYERGLRELVQKTAPGRVLWLELEIGDQTESVEPAILRATVNADGGVRTLELARTSYHPATLAVRQDSARELSAVYEHER